MNGHRPAVDALFRTAAASFGPRVIGVVLSGALDDGTAGLLDIRSRGGLALVQDPVSAVYAGMPASALAHLDPDAVGTPKELARAIVERCGDEVEHPSNGPAEGDLLDDELRRSTMSATPAHSTHSDMTCPSCNGPLYEHEEEGLLRFRCRVGHEWSAGSLLAEKSETLELALWTPLTALEEKADLVGRLAGRAEARGNERSARRFAEQHEDLERRADTIRVVLSGLQPAPSVGEVHAS